MIGGERVQGIYIIVCLVNSRVYIGQSKHIQKRWLEHREELQNGCHCNKHLQNAWNKYGEKSFVFSVLELCESDKLTEREQYWIDYYGGINSKNTYNFRDAGSRGGMSEETRKIMSENTKKLRQNPDWVAKNAQAIRDSWTLERRQYMRELKTGTTWTDKQRQSRKYYDELRRGRSRSDETKKKISQSLLGHAVSEETRQKLSEASKKQIHKPLTEEQRKHISDAAKRGWEKRRQRMKKGGNVAC